LNKKNSGKLIEYRESSGKIRESKLNGIHTKENNFRKNKAKHISGIEVIVRKTKSKILIFK